MPSLQVRDMPPVLYAKLKQMAQREHRSIAQETIVLLERSLGIRHDPKARRNRLVQEISSLSIDASNLSDPVDMIRRDRDR